MTRWTKNGLTTLAALSLLLVADPSLGVRKSGRAKAYPFVELDRAGGRVEDVFAERSLTVEFDAEHQTGRVVDAKGQEVPTVIAYWFAWLAFHPKGEVFAAD